MRWWAEVQQKGERQTLLGYLANGWEHSGYSVRLAARALVQRYPEVGPESLIQVAGHQPDAFQHENPLTLAA